MILRRAFVNLIRHREQERRNRVPYNIWAMCGAGVFNDVVLQPDKREIRPDFKGRIIIAREEIVPIVRNRNRTYGGAGQHWSDRQKVEPLFESPVFGTARSK
jgi:hypothetical protein